MVAPANTNGGRRLRDVTRHDADISQEIAIIAVKIEMGFMNETRRLQRTCSVHSCGGGRKLYPGRRKARAIQSAVSYSVRMLEQKLGVRLISRTTRSLSLTDAGQRMLRNLRP